MAVSKTGYVVGAIAGAGVAAVALAGSSMHWPPPAAGERPELIKASTAPMFAPPPGAPLSFADIFEKVSPAVVSIDVTTKVDAKTLRGIPGFENFPFDLVPKGRRGQVEGEVLEAGDPAQRLGVDLGGHVDGDHSRGDLLEDVREGQRRAGRRGEHRRGGGLDQQGPLAGVGGRPVQAGPGQRRGGHARAHDGAHHITRLGDSHLLPVLVPEAR